VTKPGNCQHGTYAKQGVQLRGHKDAARHIMLLAHARQVLHVFLAAWGRDYESASGDREAEYFLCVQVD